MRTALVALLGFIGLSLAGGTGARADDDAEVEKELKKFQGTWKYESVETGESKKTPPEYLRGMTITYKGDKYTIRQYDKVIESATQKIDPSKSPKTLDVDVTEGPNKGKVILGIYEISGDTLKLCIGPKGKKRPTEFKGVPGSQILFTHKRVKK